jgi:hypothetical protein
MLEATPEGGRKNFDSELQSGGGRRVTVPLQLITVLENVGVGVYHLADILTSQRYRRSMQ